MTVFIASIVLSLVTHLDHSAQREPSTGPGIVTGVVVNEQGPAANVIVQAFPAPRTAPNQHGPFTTSAIGQASTDSQGRFRIAGLSLGEYLVAARVRPLPFSDSPKRPPMYAATFYPSAIDHQAAVRVPAVADVAVPIKIALVQVRGARISGSAVSASGRPAAGMPVSLFHRFGGEGSGSLGGVVGANGTFETPPLPPGWYQLTIGTRPSEADGKDGEFASTLLELQDRDVDGLSLVLGAGASITGRIVAEAGAVSPSAVAMRVSASLVSEYVMSQALSARVASDGSFRMTGLSGSYQFSVNADRQPFVQVTRVAIGGREYPATVGVELVEGDRDVVVFVSPREPLKSMVDNSLSTEALVERFKSEKFFWRQFLIAEQIVERQDASVLPSLIGWLTHEDRHIRGNVAFIAGRLGDPRGFQVIAEILTDRSDRPEGQGARAAGDGRYRVANQIATDRYYAAHLLGDLRDPQAVPILVSLLKDPEVNSVVPWALGQIGDKRAVGPLINALDDESPSMRVLAIYGLETLNAKEALPRLNALLDDHRTSNFGAQASVADAARAAIAKLPPQQTLGAELLARSLPVPSDAADVAQPITSYKVLDDSLGFVIAYYGVEPDGRFHELRVRSYDKRTRNWRSKTFPEPIGSVLHLLRGAGYLYISGHSSPSAAPLLVVSSETLELRRELDGWPMLVLDDGRIVFHRSMVHFAPAHGGALALYNPVADREDSLYPPPAVKNKRGIEREGVSDATLLVNRSFDVVKKGTAPGTIEFVAYEQRMRVNRDNLGDPAGPARRLRVVCNVAAARPTCTARIVK